MEIAILLFDRLTALDALGPYEVLSRVPGNRIRLVAKEPGLVRTDNASPLGLMADEPISAVERPDVLVVPGGPGEHQARQDPEVLDWVRAVHEHSRWTTSVCTGSLILGAAGLLKGLRATSHWAALEFLREFGAEPTGERVVRQGKVITAAGVSSGIDMALELLVLEHGEAMAQAIQLAIEYDPQPPVDAGSPDKAPPEVLETVRGAMSRLTR
jgi:transcriptional regulator GlxA family with amidase domain